MLRPHRMRGGFHDATLWAAKTLSPRVCDLTAEIVDGSPVKYATPY